jgi:hypothetical protein
MNPVGFFVPPAIIFPGKRMKPELFRDVPEGTVLMISGGGFINNELSVKWLKVFSKHAESKEDDSVHPIVDSHMSHCSFEAVTFLREYHITLLSLPPRSINKLQLLDRGIFGSLEKVYIAEADKWMHNHPELGIPQSDIFRNASEKVAKMKIAKNYFMLQDYIHLTQTCFLIRIFFHQKSLIGPKEI